MTKAKTLADTVSTGGPLATPGAVNLPGGSQGSVPYQSAAGVTALLAPGTAGHVLTSGGAGANPTWAAAVTAPAGSTGQVQYNNAGAFGALASGTSGQVLTSAGAGAPPTWAAPPASAGTVTAVASGSLSDGTKVIVNSDGTVSAVTATGASTLTSVTAGLSSGVAYGDYNTVSGVYGSQDNCIVVFYIGTTANRYLNVVAGTIVGTTVTFGTPVVISSSSFQQGINYGIVSAYDAVNNRYHCIVKPLSGNYGTNAYATINPNTLGIVGYGFQTAYWANGYSPVGYGFIASKTTTQGLIVFCAQTDGYTYAHGVTFTASYPYISIGAPTLIDGYYGSYPMIPSFNSDATKAVVPYSRDSGNMAVALLSCSGDTVSLNALQTIEAVNTASYPKVSAYSPALDKFLVAWGTSTGSTIKGSVVTVSGSSLSYGTPVVINGLGSNDFPYDITYYELTGDFWFSALRFSRQLTISGTTFTQGGSNSSINNLETQYGTSYFYNPVSATLVQTSWGGNTNKVQLCNATAYSSTLTSTNFLGISNAAYTNGQTATIQTVGSTDDAQSGLTPGLKYYVSADGTLSALATTQPYAGVALSATKLVIKG